MSKSKQRFQRKSLLNRNLEMRAPSIVYFFVIVMVLLVSVNGLNILDLFHQMSDRLKAPGIGLIDRFCMPRDHQCRIRAEKCLERCESTSAFLLAKCTTVAAFTGPLTSFYISVEEFPFVNSFITSFLIGLSPFCEGIHPCDENCSNGRDIENVIIGIQEMKKDLKRADKDILQHTENLMMSGFQAILSEARIDLGLSNSYQETWTALAANELLYEQLETNGLIKDIFIDIVTKPTGERSLELIVYTFSEMIRGDLSYVELAPKKFCSEAVITSLLQAQTKSREMLAYLGIITKDEILTPQNLKEEFRNEQIMQNDYIGKKCGSFFTSQESRAKMRRRRVRRDNEERASKRQDTPMNMESVEPSDMEITLNSSSGGNLPKDVKLKNILGNPNSCQKFCQTVVTSTSAWCEGLMAFGSHFMCATLVLTGVSAGCTLGLIVSQKSALGAFCASELVYEVCNECGDPTSIGDVLEALEAISDDAKNLTKRLQETPDLVERFQNLSTSFRKGFDELKDEHFAINAYGHLLREIRFLGKRFSRITFDNVSNQPVKSSPHYRRFVTQENLVLVMRLLSEFYVMINGSPNYPPFNIKSIYEVDPSSYCRSEVVKGIEETQLKLIYIWGFLATHLNVNQKDKRSSNAMIREWRERHTKLLEKSCSKLAEEVDLSLLAKFLAADC